MTAQEAITELRSLETALDGYCELNDTGKIVFDMAIEALKKRIPMRMPGTYTNYKCAVCGRRIRSGKGSSCFKSRDNFCQRCGQAVDWSEEDDANHAK